MKLIWRKCRNCGLIYRHGIALFCSPRCFNSYCNKHHLKLKDLNREELESIISLVTNYKELNEYKEYCHRLTTWTRKRLKAQGYPIIAGTYL